MSGPAGARHLRSGLFEPRFEALAHGGVLFGCIVWLATGKETVTLLLA